MKKLNKLFGISLIGILLFSCGSNASIETPNEKIGVDSSQLPAEKTVIIDVRSKVEWETDGHANCSVNIPLPELESRISEFSKSDKIVFVCRSGNRAGSAQQIFQNAGFEKVENLGAWQNIECK